MSQQEFSPESKGDNRQEQSGEEAASAYYQKAERGLKEEHPSTFEDAVPPYAYRAQDSRNSSYQQAGEQAITRRRTCPCPVGISLLQLEVRWAH